MNDTMTYFWYYIQNILRGILLVDSGQMIAWQLIYITKLDSRVYIVRFSPINLTIKNENVTHIYLLSPSYIRTTWQICLQENQFCTVNHRIRVNSPIVKLNRKNKLLSVFLRYFNYQTKYEYTKYYNLKMLKFHEKFKILKNKTNVQTQLIMFYLYFDSRSIQSNFKTIKAQNW